MTGIFINYRREDSSAYAGRLYDLFVAHFGSGSVFMDIDAIGPGEDFREVIQQTCASCRVMLAVIGKSWATACDKAGRIRLQNESDFVRLEIVSALIKGLRVIPVLVGGAEMPESSALPADIQSLVFRNAWEISDRRFRQDVQGLAEAVQKILEAEPPKHPPAPDRESDVPKTSVPTTPSPTSHLDPGPQAKTNTELPPNSAQEMSLPKPEVRGDASSESWNAEVSGTAEDAKTDTALPEVDIRQKKESLLDEQRMITKAILHKWLERGSRRGPDAEMERLQRRSEEVKKQLLKIATAEMAAKPR